MSCGTGGTLARYAAEGVTTYLVTATRASAAGFMKGQTHPGPEIVGRTREANARRRQELGVSDVRFLTIGRRARPRSTRPAAIGKIVGHICRVRPQVVVTFAPDGAYGRIRPYRDQSARPLPWCVPLIRRSRTAAQTPHRVAKRTSSRGAESGRVQAALRKLVATSMARRGRRCRGPAGR